MTNITLEHLQLYNHADDMCQGVDTPDGAQLAVDSGYWLLVSLMLTALLLACVTGHSWVSAGVQP